MKTMVKLAMSRRCRNEMSRICSMSRSSFRDFVVWFYYTLFLPFVVGRSSFKEPLSQQS